MTAMILALLLFGLFCFGGMWAGAWVEKNATEFRVGEIE